MFYIYYHRMKKTNVKRILKYLILFCIYSAFYSAFILQKFKINDIQRVEVPEIPVVAIREIVINSLVHSDYYADSEYQVTIDPEFIEIYNPGAFGEFTPLDYVEKALPSRTKHKVIQGVIFKAFDVETLGRGLKRTDKACKEYNISWDYQKYSFGFSFIFRRKSDNLNKHYDNLSTDAKKLLNFMENNKGILESAKIAMGIIDKKERTTNKVINELVDYMIIERIGSNKSGYWRVID